MNTTPSPRLVLANPSPRRLELLRSIGVVPDDEHDAPIDETPHPKELPRHFAARRAQDAALAVAQNAPDDFALSVDSVIAVGRRVLGVPRDRDHARQLLTLLSGRRHRVFGGVCLRVPGGAIRRRVCRTLISMKRLEAREIEDYLDSQEWSGLRGGYDVRGRAAAFIRSVNGSPSNAEGVPLLETAALLRGCGAPISADVRRCP